MSITIRVTFWRVLLAAWVTMMLYLVGSLVGDIGSTSQPRVVGWGTIAVALEFTFVPLLIGFMVGRESRADA